MAEAVDHTVTNYIIAAQEGFGDAGPDVALAQQDRVEAAAALRKAGGLVLQDYVRIADGDPRYMGIEP